MKIWIDILTPKQVNLFSVFVQRLRELGHEVIVTARHYREVEQLLQIRNIDARVIGKHGGGDLSLKLIESSKRITELAGYVAKENPGLAISFCSPEAARVSYGLAIIHYAICDSPHAEAVCKLSLPLSRKLFTPRAVPKVAWKRYAITSSNIVQYDALDPAVWIRAYAHRQSPNDRWGLHWEKPIVVLRTEEEYASYLLRSETRGKNIIGQLARRLSKLGVEVVVLPRYEKQAEMLRRELSDLATVPAKVVDAIGLLSRTSAFVGAGGTMSAEAALMGVPTISCYPSEPTYVDRYLFKLGLAERILSADRIVSRVRRFIADPKLANRQKEKAGKLLAKMEDPVDVVMAHLGLLRRPRRTARSTGL